MINFEFDKADIRSADQGTLDRKAAVLAANTNVRIRIAGHADERGSDEYNLALGNRRAAAAKRYLESKGVDGGADRGGVVRRGAAAQSRVPTRRPTPRTAVMSSRSRPAAKTSSRRSEIAPRFPGGRARPRAGRGGGARGLRSLEDRRAAGAGRGRAAEGGDGPTRLGPRGAARSDHPGAAAGHGLPHRHATVGRAAPGRSLHRPLQHPAAAGPAAGAHGPEPAAAHRAPHPARGAGRADGARRPFRATARGPMRRKAAPRRRTRCTRRRWRSSGAAVSPPPALGLREMLRQYPTSERAPDALYFIGQSFASENPDSAAPTTARWWTSTRRRLGPRPRSTTSASWPSGGRTWQARGTRTSG